MALLGQGGMADVYLACTQGPGGFQKLLVVKLARFSGDPMFSTMFLDEARLAAQLNHPHVVQTYEVGEEGSRHYLVMEYLDGANLARLRQRARRANKTIPLRLSLQIVVDVLEGLAYAHQARGIDGRPLNIVHRDMTPSNIIITSSGVAKILDFGIAKGADTQSFTQTGRFSGKVNYMPPEQLRGESVDHRADIFSAGVILAESIINDRFWGDLNPAMVAAKLNTGDLPKLDNVPDLDPELRRICERALAPNRDDRYPNAAIFRTDLNRFLQKTGGSIENEEIAAFVHEYTTKDREKLQRVVDGTLRRAMKPPPITTPPELPSIENTPSSGRGASNAAEATEGATIRHRTHPAIDDEVQIEVTSPKKMSLRKRLLVMCAAAAVTVIIVLVVANVLSRDSKPTGATPSTAMVRFEVLVSPPEATVALDGQPLGGNPYVGTFPRDSKVHELIVKADGYEPQTRKLTLEQDQVLQLSLSAVKPPPPVVAPPPPTPEVATTAPAPEPTPSAVKPKPKHAVSATKPTTATKPAATTVTTKPATTTPAATAATPPAGSGSDTKRHIDGDALDPKSKKRKLETDVFDTKKTNSIDRDNPYNK